VQRVGDDDQRLPTVRLGQRDLAKHHHRRVSLPIEFDPAPDAMVTLGQDHDRISRNRRAGRDQRAIDLPRGSAQRVE
jgi:hypothetical protein